MPVISRDVERAAAALRAGKVVAFATETVYGLGADATNAAAVAAVYRMKGRPAGHPLIAHVAQHADMWRLAPGAPAAARKLAARFMPGPLTLLLPKAADVLPAICGGADAVGFRAPAHPLALALLREFGGAVAAPSANKFGGVSPTTAAHVAAEFAGEADLLVLDGGECEVGIESTIAGFDGEAVFVARPGDVSEADIAAATGADIAPAPAGIRAPGTLAKHYAPSKKTRLAAAADIAEAGAGVGAIARRRPARAAAWRPAAAAPRLFARDLYRHLRELDAADNVAEIAVEAPPVDADWRAVNDRLRRAVGGE